MYPIIQGADNLEIKNLSGVRGAIAAPAVPATTIPLQNPFWRDGGVNISGNSIAAVKLAGVSLGLSGTLAGATVFVPSGKTIELDSFSTQSARTMP